MSPPSPLTAGSRRSAERVSPCAACGANALGLVLGICIPCREGHKERLQAGGTCSEPGRGSACGLCAAPIDLGHYCGDCQRRFSAASVNARQAPGPRRR